MRISVSSGMNCVGPPPTISGMRTKRSTLLGMRTSAVRNCLSLPRRVSVRSAGVSARSVPSSAAQPKKGRQAANQQESLQKEEARLANRLERLYLDFADGELDRETYRSLKDKATKDLAEVRSAIAMMASADDVVENNILVGDNAKIIRTSPTPILPATAI